MPKSIELMSYLTILKNHDERMNENENANV